MTPRRIVLYTVLVLSVLVAFYLVYRVKEILILTVIAILLAIAIEPLVTYLHRRGLRLGLSILLVYFIILVAVGLIGFLIVPVVAQQVTGLVEELPKTVARLQSYALQIDNNTLRSTATTVLTNLDKSLLLTPGLAQGVFDVTVSVAGTLFGTAMVFVITYYWLTERNHIRNLVISLFKAENRPRVRGIWEDIESKLGGWVRGQLILCGMIGAAAAAGYLVLGIKYALILAIVATVAELIPMAGPYIGFSPAVIVGFTQSFWLGLSVGAYCVVVQFIEGNVLLPRIMKSTVGISPLTVILAMLVGASLLGIVGALLAVPVAAVIQVLYRDLVSRSELGDAKETAKLDQVAEEVQAN
ncbi:MAG: AI-2E family transporter [Chloroflexi bacterium]|nr:AI-2E family transporter [Chloroflexota bacterium]